MVKGENTTALTRGAPKSNSLRTTVPIFITRQFDLKEGDKLSWELQPTKDVKLVIIVTPRKQQ
jgi:hypothetical protein